VIPEMVRPAGTDTGPPLAAFCERDHRELRERRQPRHRGPGRLDQTSARAFTPIMESSSPPGPSRTRTCSAGLMPSFDSVGDGLDNASEKSFWSSMPIELLNRPRWKTRVEQANAIAAGSGRDPAEYNQFRRADEDPSAFDKDCVTGLTDDGDLHFLHICKGFRVSPSLRCKVSNGAGLDVGPVRPRTWRRATSTCALQKRLGPYPCPA
jgi:hypothetical protein